MKLRMAGCLWGAALMVGLLPLDRARGQGGWRLAENGGAIPSQPVAVFEAGGSGIRITALPAGMELQQSPGLGPGWRKCGVDPVSRLVAYVHGSPSFDPSGFSLACTVGNLLQAPDGAPMKVIKKVQQWHGNFLPFTLYLAEGPNPLPVGAPLRDGSGRVAGVVSRVESRGRVLLVPGEVVERVVADLVEHGRLRRAHLGVSMSPARPEASLTQVMDGGAAARAGLKAGDRIRKVDGAPVSGYADAVHAFFLMRPGRQAAVEIARDGRVMVLEVKPDLATK
ncbi:S1C family serine protease [Haloferula sargassicola]|uniref:PDZ domain-containing protein n=1 Tax=Haloferula sargassicola TaxID=490096 RepID=A0ABP9UHV0_9BACT